MNITSESAVLNESMKKFQPPLEKVPENFENSLESHLPDTARKGVIGGV